MNVPDKATFYRMQEEGRFGNRLRHWQTVEAMEADNYQGLVSIRYRQPASPFCLYDVPAAKVRERMAMLQQMRANPELFVFNEAAPDHHLLLQGEVMRSEQYLTLFYSIAPLRMRAALERGRQATGLVAVDLLRGNLSPASLDDMQELFDRFDGHVIEFSTYAVDLGIMPNRNTIFWEVRAY